MEVSDQFHTPVSIGQEAGWAPAPVCMHDSNKVCTIQPNLLEYTEKYKLQHFWSMV